MKTLLKHKPILLQKVGSQKKLGSGNDVDYRGFFLEGFKFERHDKVVVDNVICDIDLWNKDYAIKQIKNGLNSCPLLYSCLFGTEYEILSEEGQVLIDSRDSFRSYNLVRGCIKFCDRKINQSRRSKLKHPQGKYIYYAVSDMFEQIEILKTKDCIYPLKFNKEELQLIIDLKNNINLEKGYEWYEKLKSDLLQIQI